MNARPRWLRRPPPRRAALVAGACLLLAAFWWQAVSASISWSQTSDELPHIAAGYTYNRFGDFRLHSENGNLPQRVHGLAPQLLGARFPMREDFWADSRYWHLGWDLFYDLNNPTDAIVLLARALNALFGVALGIFIFLVARRWYGGPAGLVALGFFAFCPNFLAHSALATSDVAATLTLTLAPYLFWRHLQQRDLSSGLIAGLASGLAFVAKFNGILLAPIYALLVLLDAVQQRNVAPMPRRFGQNLLLCLGQAAASILIIWAFFDFRFAIPSADAPPLRQLAWSWDEMLGGIGGMGHAIEWLRAWKLLPEAWLFGLTNVLAGAVARQTFFAGDYSYTGWWEFFPTLILVKTPPALLGAGLLSAVLGGLRFRRKSADERRDTWRRWTPLLVTSAVVFGTALTSNLNIGHRHILPLYPALFIGVARLARHGRAAALAALALLFGQAASAATIRPHYLAYFNAIAGGPDKAYRLVVDSSLDWGQALPSLAEWLRAHRKPGEKIYLSYFGSAWPPHYGVRPNYFLPSVTVGRPQPVAYEFEPGLYCISATSLAEVYSDYRGPWQPGWDAALERLRATGENQRRYDELRFARLCKYLQSRPPDAHAGHAILIYRLDAQEIEAALHQPVYGW